MGPVRVWWILEEFRNNYVYILDGGSTIWIQRDTLSPMPKPMTRRSKVRRRGNRLRFFCCSHVLWTRPCLFFWYYVEADWLHARMSRCYLHRRHFFRARLLTGRTRRLLRLVRCACAIRSHLQRQLARHRFTLSHMFPVRARHMSATTALTAGVAYVALIVVHENLKLLMVSVRTWWILCILYRTTCIL